MAKLKVYGRIAFPSVFEAKPMKDDEGKVRYRYELSVLFPKGDKQLRLIDQTREMVAKNKWGEKADAILAKLIPADKTFLRDGDDKDYQGYEGMMYISASNTVKPLVIGPNREPLQASSGRPYGGCYCWVVLDIYAMTHKQGGKQINASLKGVQFVKDGEAFAGGPPADEDDFEDLSVGDEETGDMFTKGEHEDEDLEERQQLARQRRVVREEEPRVRADRQTMGRPREERVPAPARRPTRPVEDDDEEPPRRRPAPRREPEDEFEGQLTDAQRRRARNQGLI